MSWFRRKPPTVTPPLMDPHEAAIMSAHNHTPQSWDALTDPERAHYRATYTKAPRYTA